MPLAAEQLLMSSDGVLASVLTIGQRKGAAAPGLRVGPLSATLSPCEGKPLSQAVALSINKGDPQELPLEAAMQ
eukprot:1435271-Pleurochrysis_carterae.AAC.1